MSALTTVKKATPFFAYFVLAFLVMAGAEIVGYGVPSISDGWRTYLARMLPIIAVMLVLALTIQAIAAIVRNRTQMRRPLLALAGIGVVAACFVGTILVMLIAGWLFLFAAEVLGSTAWQYRRPSDLIVLVIYGLPLAMMLMIAFAKGALAGCWEYLIDLGTDLRASISKWRGNA